MTALPFLSQNSADALISDLRPTSLAPSALAFVNALLDELLVSIVTSAGSLNPIHLRSRGVSSVFGSSSSAEAQNNGHAQSREIGSQNTEFTRLSALGRAAVGEAEVEIRSWYESHPLAKLGQLGFPPDGSGRGVTAEAEKSLSPFPTQAAIELMRLKVVTLSTFTPDQSPPQEMTEHVLSRWRNADGDLSDETVSPAGLWLTAVLEHICEHILSRLSQVVARDSAVVTASVHDLYTALCENESTYGFFKLMDVKRQIEDVTLSSMRGRRPASRQGPPRVTHVNPRSSPTDSPHESMTSITSTVRDREEILTRKPPLSGASTSSVNGRMRPVTESLSRLGVGGKSSSHNDRRISSNLSLVSKGTGQQQSDDTLDGKVPSGQSIERTDDDFESLLRSNETVRVSLTPSRLSVFEMPTAPHVVSSPLTNSPNSPRSDPRASISAVGGAYSSSETSLASGSVQASEQTRPTQRSSPSSRSWTAPPKLVPRGATIEEKNEEDGPGHTLMELLNHDPQTYRVPTRHSVAVERSLPAVVLGPSIPQRPATSLDVSATLNDSGLLSASPERQSGLIHHQVRSVSGGPKSRGREAGSRDDASDYHDFLAKTEKPVIHVEDSGANSQPKKNRFSKLMWRMSSVSSRKDKDEKHSDTPTDGSRHPESSQASLRNDRSGDSTAQSTNAPSLSSLSAPGVPKPKQVSRKPSLVKKWAQQVTSSDGKANRTSRLIRNTPPMPSGEFSDVDEHSSPRSSLLVSPGLGFQPVSDIVGHSGNSHAKTYSFDTIEEADFAANPQGPEQALATLTAASSKRSVISARSSSHLSPKGSPSLHFMPSPETTSPSKITRVEDNIKPKGSGDAQLDTEVVSAHANPSSVALPNTVSGPREHIPICDLVPLRHLLDNAVTARECQILLDAILSQLGVPRVNETVVRPEDRIAAWLLAGREGPVGDISVSRRGVGSSSSSRCSTPVGRNRSRSALGDTRRFTPEHNAKSLLPAPTGAPSVGVGREPVADSTSAPLPSKVNTSPNEDTDGNVYPSPASAKHPLVPSSFHPRIGRVELHEVGDGTITADGEIEAVRKAELRRARRMSSPLLGHYD